ncbi:MAG: cytochrome P450, partial [Pseudomonadota bacterium]|nr:cytochrome P450 [Pseudomonadota bacterium]
FGASLRALIMEYGLGYGRPRLLDIVLPPSVPTLGDLRRRRFQTRWMGFITEIIRTRAAAAATDAPGDLFDLLVAARDPETGRGFTREQLRDQVATMILAGHETTGVLMFWALTLLAQDPAEQQRVADEVHGLDLATTVARGEVPELPRTRAVVSETLRLYPSAFTLARAAKATDRAGAIEIPKGSILLIAPWVLHRHRRLWREPEAFDPSRFLPGAPPPPRFAYLPFGAGPRVCVGAQFALIEATLVLAALIQAFEVSLESTRPVLPTAIITTHPDHAPAFRLRPRISEGAASCPPLTTFAATIPS